MIWISLIILKLINLIETSISIYLMSNKWQLTILIIVVITILTSTMDKRCGNS